MLDAGRTNKPETAIDPAKDPVCGMTVAPATARHRHSHDGHDYYFCSAGCRTKFIADPQTYLNKAAAQDAHAHTHAPAQAGCCAHGHAHHHAHAASPGAGALAADKDAIFTCPMHPEVRQKGPGACPICGMALEPEVASAESGPSAELVDMTRRFWIALVLAVPVVVLDMGAHLLGAHLVGAHGLVTPHVSHLIQLVFASAVVLWAGWPFFVRGWQSVITRNLNMFTLIAMGTGVAYGYSLVAALAPDLFPATLHDAHASVPVYFEAATVITVLVLLGQVLELRAREATSGAIKALLTLAPSTARRLRDDGTDEDVALDAVQAGDHLRVRPGEKVPVDGEIVEGRSALDESMITGESMPVTKEVGAKVIGGTLNRSGGFVMRAERVGHDTLLSRIVQMVAQAQRSRAPMQRLADRVAGWFVLAVIAAAVLAFAAWWGFGPQPRFAFALLAAVSVLIIACPCALGLATPMSIMVGVGRGAKSGILIKNAEALERMERVDTLVFDKTGTLTQGRLKVVAVIAAASFAENDVLRMAAGVERGSEHPLATAIMQAAAERGLAMPDAGAFAAHAGEGVGAEIEGRRIAAGNAAFLGRLGIDVTPLAAAAETWRNNGASAIFVAVDGVAAGVIAVADTVKPSAAAALKALTAEGLRVVMLTGDNKTTAQAIARGLGITAVKADVMPDQKADVVAALRREGRVVAMVGDGINDAPALAAADVGIAMGTGTDVAIESAGMTLLRGDLDGIVQARHLSRATMRNIRQNLFFAFAYNAAGIPIAAGVLYPVFGVLLSPVVAAAAMALSSVSVIGNALRLRAAKL